MPSVLSKQYSVYDLFMMRVADKDNFYEKQACATAHRNKNQVYKPILAYAKQCKTYDELTKFIIRTRMSFKIRPTTT